MGVDIFKVVLDKKNRIYVPGDEMKGQIQLTISSPTKINKITCKIKGKAKTKWEVDNGSTTYIYLGEETYFNNTNTVIEKPDDEALELEPGQYIFDFEYQLPQNIPPTYSATKGDIQYTVSALLDRPWMFDKTASTLFVIKEILDLNELALINPNIKEPAILQIAEQFCCCFYRGEIIATITFPYIGFIRGQKVPITVNVENGSNVKVVDLSYKLYKVQTCFTTERGYKKVKEEALLGGFIGLQVPSRSVKDISYHLRMPDIPFVNLRNCNIIDVDYKLTFELILGSACTLSTPKDLEITFGTVQLQDFETILLPEASNEPPTYKESQKT